jgi:hypothetical protein
MIHLRFLIIYLQARMSTKGKDKRRVIFVCSLLHTWVRSVSGLIEWRTIRNASLFQGWLHWSPWLRTQDPMHCCPRPLTTWCIFVCWSIRCRREIERPLFGWSQILSYAIGSYMQYVMISSTETVVIYAFKLISLLLITATASSSVLLLFARLFMRDRWFSLYCRARTPVVYLLAPAWSSCVVRKRKDNRAISEHVLHLLQLSLCEREFLNQRLISTF